MFADALLPAPEVVHCRGCHRPCRHGTYDGYGPRCAQERGLIPRRVRLPRPRGGRQDGPDLFHPDNQGDATMRKIPTLFVRDPEDRRYVTSEINPECKWVLDGEGVATRKYDGTCVMFNGDRWWARREVKPGKKAPANYVPVETDPATGKTVGWEPIEQSAFAKFHTEAVDYQNGTGVTGWPKGTYELVGPKINGNPERADRHELWAHATAEVLDDFERTYDGVRAAVIAHAAYRGVEGIVWHHPDGRMAKLKVRDFPKVDS